MPITDGINPRVIIKRIIIILQPKSNVSKWLMVWPNSFHDLFRILNSIILPLISPESAVPAAASVELSDVESDLFFFGIRAIISVIIAIPDVACTKPKQAVRKPAVAITGTGNILRITNRNRITPKDMWQNRNMDFVP